MEREKIIGLMIERQHFVHKISSYKEYEEFFRFNQPVPPVFFSAPGSPPSLVFRTTFDDERYNDGLRAKRKIIKGRFQGGNVGYVYLDDIEIYIGAYKKEIKYLNELEYYLIKLLKTEGPLNCHQFMELSGLKAKEITFELKKLQEAFIVFEDQVDSEWDRSWYLFESEFPEINVNKFTRIEALTDIIQRTLKLLVFTSINQLKGWLRLPLKDIKAAIAILLNKGIIVSYTVDDIEGYLLLEDIPLLKEKEIPHFAIVLHRSDIVVRAEEERLKELFNGNEVLSYLFVDGEFKGAICGHWRIGPYDVEDIVLLLHDKEKALRKAEILDAVRLVYQEPYKILRYDGKEL